VAAPAASLTDAAVLELRAHLPRRGSVARPRPVLALAAPVSLMLRKSARRRDGRRAELRPVLLRLAGDSRAIASRAALAAARVLELRAAAAVDPDPVAVPVPVPAVDAVLVAHLADDAHVPADGRGAELLPVLLRLAGHAVAGGRRAPAPAPEPPSRRHSRPSPRPSRCRGAGTRTPPGSRRARRCRRGPTSRCGPRCTPGRSTGGRPGRLREMEARQYSSRPSFDSQRMRS